MKATVCSLLLLVSIPTFAQRHILDTFDKLEGWNVHASDGVVITISHDAGKKGKAVRIDFEFTVGSGYGGINKKFSIRLPANYQFSFDLKADAPDNNFEFKIIDTTGENVWWLNQRNFTFPTEWKTIRIKKRQIHFAWGPSNAELSSLGGIEFIVAAGTGGRGTIWLDNLVLEARDDSPTFATPIMSASSSHRDAAFAHDGDLSTVWKSADRPPRQWLMIDFQKEREFSGLIIHWDSLNHAREFQVSLSNDKKEWTTVYDARNVHGGTSYIYLPDQESRFVKLDLAASSRKAYGIREIAVMDVETFKNENSFFTYIAAHSPVGHYPKYLTKRQSYWTIVGVTGDTKEALINEQGMIEVDKSGFSIEPFLVVNGKLVTWNDVHLSQTLEKEYLPIPNVLWRYDDIELGIQTFAEGEPERSSLYVRYRVENKGMRRSAGSLFVALRPFQVLPPWQDLNITGGVSRIQTIERDDRSVFVNGAKMVHSLSSVDGFGAAEFDQGDITSFLKLGTLPEGQKVADKTGCASAALRYNFDLASGESKEWYIIVPFHTIQFGPNVHTNAASYVEEKLRTVIDFWEATLSVVDIQLPASAMRLVNTVKSTLAYILINRDGPAIQPGSRTYERAWIRDGSLTSAALLRMGFKDEVKEYLEWYSRHQYENGKVPCVVDARGPDPVPEHDSHGQLIYGILQYFLFTKDTTFLKAHWNNVVKAVEYIEYLRAQRMTDQYKTPEFLAYYGLVPESISHEGYSAKPMHSYWDNFFVLRGLKDAATIARILGEKEQEAKYTKLVSEFRADFYNSIQLAMTAKKINFIPGCVELGDFDATSTAIGIYPGGELEYLPRAAVERTFERYYEHFTRRLDPSFTWKDYTPYEIRVCGTFLFLGNKTRTHEMLNFFFGHQRPTGWNHWAEVVWRDPETPRMIGDMPHTWVGSDYISVFRSLFVYEREADNTLVIGAGIPEEWIQAAEGVRVKNLPTYFGTLSYSVKEEKGRIVYDLDGNLELPKDAKLALALPNGPISGVTVNGKELSASKGKDIQLEAIPARVVVRR